MPHMKFQHLLVFVSISTAVVNSHASAQSRTQPVPTGQVPKAYTGQQANPNASFQPKPTGQIAPEVPGQPLGTIAQPAPTGQIPKAPVQDLGFEVNSRPVTQQGMVPKVNTTQDPRTMPERYQPASTNQQQTISKEQMDQVIEKWETLPPPNGNASPATPTSGTSQQSQRTPGGQSATGTSKTQTGTATPQAQQYQSTTPSGSKRVEPRQ
jgi:hypothetical protein